MDFGVWKFVEECMHVWILGRRSIEERWREFMD